MGEQHLHTPSVKVENGYIITYCTLCGEILDSRPVPNEDQKAQSERWQEGLIHDNGGRILHG